MCVSVCERDLTEVKQTGAKTIEGEREGADRESRQKERKSTDRKGWT